MSEEKKKLKEYQKNYCGAKKGVSQSSMVWIDLAHFLKTSIHPELKNIFQIRQTF